MRLIDGLDGPGLLPSVATIGFFDGVHCGHRFLLRRVCDLAAGRGLASVVVTFPRHPRQVLHPHFVPELLTSATEKVDLLEQAGIDYCLMPDFTPALAALSARQFMQQLRQRSNVRILVTGYDHHFGCGGHDSLDDYVRYGREVGVEVVPAAAYHAADAAGEEISSSGIRRLLHRGEVELASCCLGYPYSLQGKVVGGYQMGRRLGYPTANLRLDLPEKLIPADGVYAVRVMVDGGGYAGMLSIGRRPTLDNGTDRSIEVHLFDFQADIYGHSMRVIFVSRLRDEQKFASLEELSEQLHRDEEAARRILGYSTTISSTK